MTLPSSRLAGGVALLSLVVVTLGCSAPSAAPPHTGAHGAGPHASHEDAELREVATIHGGAGPWAVLGYRMGKYALAELRLPRHSFDLEVTHRSPRAVQFTCIADGASAATGASVGKLNLSLEPADESSVATVYRNKKTGQEVALRPAKAFVTRFKDVPREGLARAGREVLALPDAELFEVLAAPPAH